MTTRPAKDADMHEEYDFSHGRRGVYYERAQVGNRVFHVSDAEDRARSKVEMQGWRLAIIGPIVMKLQSVFGKKPKGKGLDRRR